MALDLDRTALVRRQLQVVLMLDCSGSMRGDRIASLSYALLTALPDLKEAAGDNPEVDVRVRVLAFGSAPHWLTAGAVPVEELVWPDLHAEGHTAMGAALEMVADTLAEDAAATRQLPPVLVLASDGYPTDDIGAGIRALMATPEGAAADPHRDRDRQRRGLGYPQQVHRQPRFAAAAGQQCGRTRAVHPLGDDGAGEAGLVADRQ